MKKTFQTCVMNVEHYGFLPKVESLDEEGRRREEYRGEFVKPGKTPEENEAAYTVASLKAFTQMMKIESQYLAAEKSFSSDTPKY